MIYYLILSHKHETKYDSLEIMQFLWWKAIYLGKNCCDLVQYLQVDISLVKII